MSVHLEKFPKMMNILTKTWEIRFGTCTVDGKKTTKKNSNMQKACGKISPLEIKSSP